MVPATTVTFENESYDLSKTKAFDLQKFSIRQLSDFYNVAVDFAHHLGVDQKAYAPISKFRDREAGEKKIAALHSSALAAIQSAKAHAKEQEKAAKKALRDVEKAMAKAESKAASGDAPATEPKRRGRPVGSKNGAKAAPKSKYRMDDRIKVLIDRATLKSGTPTYEDFGHYRNGMTVAEFYATIGTKKGGVRLHFDSLANRIEIGAHN